MVCLARRVRLSFEVECDWLDELHCLTSAAAFELAVASSALPSACQESASFPCSRDDDTNETYRHASKKRKGTLSHARQLFRTPASIHLLKLAPLSQINTTTH
jgi:hypothetical protein